jgi:hypothetical protein
VAATWVALDLLPFPVGSDRAHALENAWKASWDGVGLPSGTRLSELLSHVGALFPGQICPHSFVYDRCHDDHCFAPPVSWHLTNGQREEIDDNWGEEDELEVQQVIEEVLDGAGGCVSPSVASPSPRAQVLR